MNDDERRQRRRLADAPGSLGPGHGDVYVTGVFSGGTGDICSAFFAYKRQTPRATALTPLQKRMESGGA
jgi:hypothetical protein